MKPALKRVVLVILFLLAATMSGTSACLDLFTPSCGGRFTACGAGHDPCCSQYVCGAERVCLPPSG